MERKRKEEWQERVLERDLQTLRELGFKEMDEKKQRPTQTSTQPWWGRYDPGRNNSLFPHLKGIRLGIVRRPDAPLKYTCATYLEIPQRVNLETDTTTARWVNLGRITGEQLERATRRILSERLFEELPQIPREIENRLEGVFGNQQIYQLPLGLTEEGPLGSSKGYKICKFHGRGGVTESIAVLSDVNEVCKRQIRERK